MRMRLLGTTTALVTPFDDAGRVDEDALRALIGAQLEAGIDGLLACGTTAETPTLSADEYRLVVRATVEEARGRVPVIAGTSGNDTRKTVELTQAARELGADLALVVTPYYNKPGPAMLEAHFRRVAAEGGLPVVLYNVPGRTGVNLPAKTAIALSTVDGIVAIKEASGDLVATQAIRYGTDRERFSVLSGDDALTLALYGVGGDGVISVASNVVPARMKAIYTRFVAGDVTGAAEMNARLFPLFGALFCEVNPVPCKAALAMMGRMGPTVREPLGGLQPGSVELVRQALADLELI